MGEGFAEMLLPDLSLIESIHSACPSDGVRGLHLRL